MKNPYLQSPQADQRYLASVLTRHGGIKPALAEVKRLADLHPSGRSWWLCMEAQLSILLAEGQSR